MAKDGLDENPVIEAIGEVDQFILLGSKAKLSLEGIDFNGGGSTANAFKSVFNVSPALDENDTIELEISNCQFNEFTNAGGGYIVRSAAPVVFNRLILKDVQIFDVAKQAFLFENNSHADSLIFDNCTFVNVGREVLLMNVASQGEATASLNHCTLDSVGFADMGYEAISLKNVDATIRNTIFTYSNTSASLLSITGANSSLDYCLFWNAATVNASDGASLGSSIIQDQDVFYTDRSRYFFSLLPVSPALNYADDDENLGDLYWDDHGILGDNAYLSMIKLNYKSINGFVHDSFYYEAVVENPSSYVVTPVRQDYNATAIIDYPDVIPGVCTITVLAENKINTETYTLSLKLENDTGSQDASNGNSRFFFYPNPCEEMLVIESDEFGYALIYDQPGRLVKKLIIDDYLTTHMISELQTGHYHICYRLAIKTGCKKLIIK